ncbi:G protein-regulated inducer of neurite outgrowth 2 isoform X2 [Emydura macquarii macquarii]|uniref:G protein-regulated inducer of neurite outgrowth 2 isoform X2 n=1 Tax=Emydura macquarii macquarii TaxID=1129001 RepID=UPI00352BC66F
MRVLYESLGNLDWQARCETSLSRKKVRTRGGLLFAMAANSHQVHTHSHQETLNSVCHHPPLSKSSSSLACIGQVSSDERQSHKQDLKKSLSSTVCQTQVSGNDVGSTLHSEWSSTQSGMVESAPAVRSTGDQSPGDNVQNRAKTTNCFLTVDQTPTSLAGKDTKMHVKSSTVENISSVCGTHQQSGNRMEGLGAAVQRSHSDLTCSCKQQNSVTCMETSATHSILSSISSSYDTSVHDMSFQTQRDGSGTSENTPNYQNRVTQIPTSSRDQKVPTNSFDSGGITHNTTIYTDPGTFHTAVLGPHMPGSGFSNRTMCSQSTGLSQGGMTYNNVSSAIYSPTVMTIHNSTALPYSARQECAVKIDGTVPAYCHSLPISSIQLVPRLMCSASESGREQVTPGYCQSLPTSDMLTFPKLVSSVSESGLDAKQILKCCSVPGEHLSHAQNCVQQSRTQQESKAAYIVFHNHQCADMIMKTKDTWTMTSMNDLTKGLKSPLECKDAEVQTIPTMECKSVATSPSVVAEDHPHVFPEVNLEHDQEGPKSPVREVRWDDEGMTWEVYGAAVDPEVLGLAIQKHLEIQIEQFQTEPIELSRENTEESPPVKEAKKRPFRTMMHSLRHPSCCAHSSTAVE